MSESTPEVIPEITGDPHGDQKVMSTATGDSEKTSDEAAASTILKNTPPSSPQKLESRSPKLAPSTNNPEIKDEVQSPTKKEDEVKAGSSEPKAEQEVKVSSSKPKLEQEAKVNSPKAKVEHDVKVGKSKSKDANERSNTSNRYSGKSNSTGRYNGGYSRGGYRPQNRYHRTSVQNNYGLKSPPYKSNFEPSDSARQKAEEFFRASIDA